MTTPRLMIAASLFALSAASAGAAGLPSLHSLASIEQIGTGNHTSIEQIGAPLANNRALVHIDGGVTGGDNGTGTIAGLTVAGMRACATPGCINGKGHSDDGTDAATGGHASHGNGKGYGHGTAAADFVMPSFASGVIRQVGEDNTALVGIKGSRNDFHIGQIGENNFAVQAIAGSGNTAVITQGGEFAAASNNIAVQLQVGDSNTAYVAQNGDRNIAKQVQVGPIPAFLAMGVSALPGSTPEALITASKLFGGADGNISLLEQNGDYNTALLVQAGSANLIALRQPGNAFASITQIGSGHQIRVEQSAGANGVTPIFVVQAGKGGGS